MECSRAAVGAGPANYEAPPNRSQPGLMEKPVLSDGDIVQRKSLWKHDRLAEYFFLILEAANLQSTYPSVCPRRVQYREQWWFPAEVLCGQRPKSVVR